MTNRMKDTSGHKYVFFLSLFPSYSFLNITPTEVAQEKEEEEWRCARTYYVRSKFLAIRGTCHLFEEKEI